MGSSEIFGDLVKSNQLRVFFKIATVIINLVYTMMKWYEDLASIYMIIFK